MDQDRRDRRSRETDGDAEQGRAERRTGGRRTAMELTRATQRRTLTRDGGRAGCRPRRDVGPWTDSASERDEPGRTTRNEMRLRRGRVRTGTQNGRTGTRNADQNADGPTRT